MKRLGISGDANVSEASWDSARLISCEYSSRHMGKLTRPTLSMQFERPMGETGLAPGCYVIGASLRDGVK